MAASCPISFQVGLIAVCNISAASMNSRASTSQPANPRKTAKGATSALLRINVVTAETTAWIAPITIATTAANSLQVAITPAIFLTISSTLSLSDNG